MRIATSVLYLGVVLRLGSAQYTTTIDVPGNLPTPYTVSSGTFAEVSSGGVVRSRLDCSLGYRLCGHVEYEIKFSPRLLYWVVGVRHWPVAQLLRLPPLPHLPLSLATVGLWSMQLMEGMGLWFVIICTSSPIQANRKIMILTLHRNGQRQVLPNWEA